MAALLSSFWCPSGYKQVEEIAFSHAVLYCTVLAVAFVGSLYVIVPRPIRALSRDDPRQIKWRAFATGLVAGGSLAAYFFFFFDCDDDDKTETATSAGVISSVMNMIVSTLYHELHATLRILLHTWILFMGPLVHRLLLVWIYHRQQQQTNDNNHTFFLTTVYTTCIQPTLHQVVYNYHQQRWIVLRNLCLAPLWEEVVFRATMVPVLFQACHHNMATTCWLGPCFFGLAHVHHAYVQYQSPQRKRVVVLALQTLFQVLYTTVFGAYVSYAYLVQRHSLVAIVVCHATCNAMGLPDVTSYYDAARQAHVYPYRYLLTATLVLGMTSFYYTGFVSQWLP